MWLHDIKTMAMGFLFNSQNYTYTMTGLTSSIQPVTEGTCPCLRWPGWFMDDRDSEGIKALFGER